jgi:hypothetical protein
MDLWWNPALEGNSIYIYIYIKFNKKIHLFLLEQAIDRVHRIGQKLPVYVTRLLIEDTVEGNILQLQNKKVQL